MNTLDPHAALSWKANSSMVGPVRVNRPLPTTTVPSIGPFVLLDHFGPVPAPDGKLPAHPHAGIEVMTYLIDGANEHTDSLGNVGQIGAGGAQWMKAGSGILHTERNLVDRSPVMHGLQIWARLPIAEQDTAPDYRAFQSDEMSDWTEDNVRFRLIAGEFKGRKGPLPIALPSIMVHIQLQGGSSVELDLPNDQHEYGCYVVEASDHLTINNAEHLEQGDMIRLPNETATIKVDVSDSAPVELFLVGGEPAPQPLVFGGSFVLDSEQAIREANHRFQSGEMGTLDGVPF
ncbi:MAG: pirin family protein [Pseudomonadota bacterium]